MYSWKPSRSLSIRGHECPATCFLEPHASFKGAPEQSDSLTLLYTLNLHLAEHSPQSQVQMSRLIFRCWWLLYAKVVGRVVKVERVIQPLRGSYVVRKYRELLGGQNPDAPPGGPRYVTAVTEPSCHFNFQIATACTRLYKAMHFILQSMLWKLVHHVYVGHWAAYLGTAKFSLVMHCKWLD